VSVIKGSLGTLNTNLAYLKENAKKKLNNLEYNLKERIKNPLDKISFSSKHSIP